MWRRRFGARRASYGDFAVSRASSANSSVIVLAVWLTRSHPINTRSKISPHEYVTTVQITAPPEAVWAVLADPVGYADWNPEIVAINGRFAPGERITARVHIGDGVMRSGADARYGIPSASTNGVGWRAAARPVRGTTGVLRDPA